MRKYSIGLFLFAASVCILSQPYICQGQSKPSKDFSIKKSADGLKWTITFHTDDLVRILDNLPVDQKFKFTGAEKGQLKQPSYKDRSHLIDSNLGLTLRNRVKQPLDLKYKKGGVIIIHWFEREPPMISAARRDYLAERTRPVYEKAHAEIAAIRSKATASKATFDAFMQKTQANQLLTVQELQVNPFVYKGQVVAIYTTFKKMISEKEAILGGFSSNILISDVPSTKFRGQSLLVIAGQVIGTKNIGSGTAPHLKYIDSHICQAPNCDELFYWRDGSRQAEDRVNNNLKSTIEQATYQFQQDVSKATNEFFNFVGWQIQGNVQKWMKSKGENDLCDENSRCDETLTKFQLAITNGQLSRPVFISAQHLSFFSKATNSNTARAAFEQAMQKPLMAGIPALLENRNIIATCEYRHMGTGPDTGWSGGCSPQDYVPNIPSPLVERKKSAALNESNERVDKKITIETSINNRIMKVTFHTDDFVRVLDLKKGQWISIYGFGNDVVNFMDGNRVAKVPPKGLKIGSSFDQSFIMKYKKGGVLYIKLEEEKQ
jgi:hypothetical protein